MLYDLLAMDVGGLLAVYMTNGSIFRNESLVIAYTESYFDTDFMH